MKESIGKKTSTQIAVRIVKKTVPLITDDTDPNGVILIGVTNVFINGSGSAGNSYLLLDNAKALYRRITGSIACFDIFNPKADVGFYVFFFGEVVYFFVASASEAFS